MLFQLKYSHVQHTVLVHEGWNVFRKNQTVRDVKYSITAGIKKTV